jgi:uncharacterized protein YcbK (DUF882 family)
MQPPRTRSRSSELAFPSVLLPAILSLFIVRDAPARIVTVPRLATDTTLAPSFRELRVVSWADALEPIEVTNDSTGASAWIRLYDLAGDIDEAQRAAFERVASRESEPHPLAPRVEQLVMKTAYHFGVHRLLLVSGWRERSGKHSTGEAIDFKLQGVPPAKVAAFLHGLARVGVGTYTNPGTQFVHVDVREPGYYWVDPSPPGVHWRELPIGDRMMAIRDATYVAEMDLPHD